VAIVPLGVLAGPPGADDDASMRSLRSFPHAAVAGLAAVAVAAPVVHAATTSSRDAFVARTINAVHVKPTGYDGTATVHLNARLTFPGIWRLLASGSHLTLRATETNCSYTVRASTQMSVTTSTQSATDHVLALTPASGRYVLDSGTRGRLVWRVTHVRTDAGVRILAAAAVPVSSYTSKALGLTGAQRLYQDVIVRADSNPKDECHTGTYRDALGPQIGDALAVLRWRSYSDSR
jgi:hypothetical protein